MLLKVYSLFPNVLRIVEKMEQEFIQSKDLSLAFIRSCGTVNGFSTRTRAFVLTTRLLGHLHVVANGSKHSYVYVGLVIKNID